MPALAAKSPGPKISVSTRSEAAAIDSMFTSPRGLSICTSRPMRREPPSSSSSCESRRSAKWTSAARLDLREDDAVEPCGSALDHVGDVAEAPAGARIVHAHGSRSRAPLEPEQRVDDLLPGRVVLLERRHRVLEVDEHLVGRQRCGLREHLRARAGNGEARAAEARESHGSDLRRERASGRGDRVGVGMIASSSGGL